MVHIYNVILLSHKKEWMWIIWTDVDGSRACYTEWSKSEREKQISYINPCICNLEKWCWWKYLQGGNRDTDVGNRLADSVGKWEGAMNWENSIDMYTLPCVKQIVSGKHGKLSLVPCDYIQGWDVRGRFKREGIPMCPYGWFVLMYGRNQHIIVKQLSSN